MLFLYVSTLSTILTWAFLHKYLNPFINAALAILGCAIEIMVTFVMLPISWAAKKIDIYIAQPMQRLKKHVHIRIPALIKAVFCALLAVGIFLLDHRYNKQLFAFNETFVVYPMVVNDMKFWVSEGALLIGGALVGLSSIYIVHEILKSLNRLLDHTMRLNVTIYR